jgi:thymidylate kinase
MSRRARGAVIAISGLDGSGKSTQADALAQTLRSAGYEPVVLWQRISHNASLKRFTAPLRFLLRVVLRVRGREPSAAPRSGVEDPFQVPSEHVAARALRERLPVVSALWVTLVAGLHAGSVRSETMRELRRGRIVIRDRYLLDSLVQLRIQYGAAHNVGVQARLIRALTPPALVAIYLDVPGEQARRRKPEEFTAHELEEHRRGYLAEAAQLDVMVLDGQLPPDELAAAVSARVLRALREL